MSDWVVHRAACTAAEMFNQLREVVRKNFDALHGLPQYAAEFPTFEWKAEPGRDSFRIVRHTEDGRRGWAKFKIDLTRSVIVVEIRPLASGPDDVAAELVPDLRPDCECRLEWRQLHPSSDGRGTEYLDLQQASRRALEGFFFQGWK